MIKKGWYMKKNTIFAAGSLIKNVSKSMTVFDKEFWKNNSDKKLKKRVIKVLLGAKIG